MDYEENQMKIAFVAFPLEFVGGTKTRLYILKEGFEELGHSVQTFYITTNTTRKPEPLKNEFSIPNILGFEKPEWLRELSDTLVRFDAYLFFGGCPHLLKNYKREEWKRIYDAVDVSKVIISITDSYIRKYYPWLIPIIEEKHIKLYANHDRNMQSIEAIKTMSKLFPLPIKIKEDMGLYSDIKENLIVDICNFKGCKHKHLLFEFGQLQPYKIIEFGDTNNPAYYQFEQALKLANNWDVEIIGWQEQDVIADTLRRAKFGLDLSRFANFKVNMDNAILEYVVYGAIPITLLPLGESETLRYINLMSPADLEKLNNDVWRKQAVEYNFGEVRTHYNYLEVCRKIIDFWNQVIGK
jgi:hypothetical protein